jgi:hypothetical protein
MIVHGIADDEIRYNGVSIISHRHEITNRNVIYCTCGAENHNGHKNLFRSEAVDRCIDEIN